MNILLKFITVNFSFLDMEKNLKEEFNCEICEEKFIIDQYYLFLRDKTMKFQIHVVNLFTKSKNLRLTSRRTIMTRCNIFAEKLIMLLLWKILGRL